MFEEFRARIVFSVPKPASDGRDQTHGCEDEEVDNYVEVRFLLDLGLLGGSVAAIQHDLRVRAGEDDQAADPRGVAHRAPAQEKLVDAGRLDLTAAERKQPILDV